jgi:hypothetical protein
MQHGGISVTYRCAQGEDCSAIAAQLQAIIDAEPDDPMCWPSGLRHRYILSPDPDLDVAVAAATWDWTYRATCAERGSLHAFFVAHYGKSPEDSCDLGATSF